MINLQKAKIKDLPKLYAMYFSIFKQSTLQGVVLFDAPNRQVTSLNLIKAIATHFSHIFIERFIIASQEGMISAIFRKKMDMVPYKITDEKEIVGFCFLKRVNPFVIEVGIIGVLSNKRRGGIGMAAMELIKSYAIQTGARRLVVRASGLKRASGFFSKCGFTEAFSEDVFFDDT